MRTIAIVNQKGGCGKTTTAINLAALYARRGLRTLLVDMDPQSHCAAGLGVPEARIEFSIGQALLADHASFNPAGLMWEVSRNLDLAPSTMTLASLESPGGGLHALEDKDRRLESLLRALSPQYDRCLIDCPPTIGLLTFNALRAARETLIPVETGFFALRGAAKQWNTVQRLIQHIGRPIACHLLATLHKPASRLANNILATMQREFAGQILPTVIREHEVLREAASFGQPVLEFAPDSEACRDFEALADWLEEHHSQPHAHIEVLPGANLLQVPSGFSDQHRRAPFAAPGSTGADFSSGASPMTATAPASTAGSRAAELVRRVTDMRDRQRTALEPAFVDAGAAPDPSVSVEEARSLTAGDRYEQSQPGSTSATASASLAHVLGVRATAQGMLFIQPLSLGRQVFIAGEFNNWSETTHPMRRNEEAEVFEAIISLLPGPQRYRLVVDGRSVPDPHNPQQEQNLCGEPVSVAHVPR